MAIVEKEVIVDKFDFVDQFLAGLSYFQVSHQKDILRLIQTKIAKFYYVDETGLLVYRENIPSLLNVSFITYHHQSCLFALAVSENDIPFSIAISVNGKPYQSQKFSEEIITII